MCGGRAMPTHHHQLQLSATRSKSSGNPQFTCVIELIKSYVIEPKVMRFLICTGSHLNKAKNSKAKLVCFLLIRRKWYDSIWIESIAANQICIHFRLNVWVKCAESNLIQLEHLRAQRDLKWKQKSRNPFESQHHLYLYFLISND